MTTQLLATRTVCHEGDSVADVSIPSPSHACQAYYEDLLAAGLSVTDRCPICEATTAGRISRYVGSHPHRPCNSSHCDSSDTRSGDSDATLVPINVKDYEVLAQRRLDHKVHGYYASGANDGITLAENKLAFQRLRILPRMLVDVTNVDMSTTILGERISMPICIAPSAMQRMAHPDGEVATVRAAARKNIGMTLSTMATTSIEDVASAAPHGLRWFQLYVHTDKAVVVQLVARAEAAGFKAVVVTVDAPMLGRREADIRNEFKVPENLRLANFPDLYEAAAENDVVDAAVAVTASNQRETFNKFFAGLISKSLTWADIKWLRTITTMKIVVKGILTPSDALKAVDAGVDGKQTYSP
jgi:(S)-2-hydroxy-acid oxidase